MTTILLSTIYILDHNFARGGSDYADQGWRSSQQDSPNLEEDLAFTCNYVMHVFMWLSTKPN